MTYKIIQEIPPKIMREKQELIKKALITAFPKIKGIEIYPDKNIIQWEQGSNINADKVMEVIKSL
jgi:hypothetical protein